ncbi:DUF6714 family protein [Cupriavidus metallidurans]|uniref:DUF6714 family protein n=1 Tax=Cupriavidus TaxID=106589 RepID=UPI0025A84683|nr:DUF6714 family protein [Cupriavidus sp. TKC]GMG90245.1 hypothetical protein Cmtc_14650 [Cupriavidus sp. TKC]
MDTQEIANTVIEAFSDVEPPPLWSIVGSREGHEPALVEKTFAGKLWDELTDDELDRDPALSFFSAEAFRYFLPAYLIRELDGHEFQQNHLAFVLTYGLTDDERSKLVNPRRYGDLTAWDTAVHKFAPLTKKQVMAIVAFLKFRMEQDRQDDPFDYQLVSEAMKNYWLPRSNE